MKGRICTHEVIGSSDNKAKFCDVGLRLGLAIGWPWPWDCGLGLGLRGLALAKNSRPKSWQIAKFAINFH